MKPVDPRLVRRSRAARRHLTDAVGAAVLSVGTVVAQAWAAADVIAAAFDGEAIGGAATVLVVAIAARGGLAWAQAVAAGRAAAVVKAELRREVVDDLGDGRRLGPRPSPARVVAALGSGLDALDAYVGRFLPQVVTAAVVPVAIASVMLVVDVWSGLTVALTVPLVVVFLVLVGLRTADEMGRRRRALERLARHFADVLDGIVTLTGFGRDQARQIEDVGDRHRRETQRSLRLAFLSSVALDLFATLSVALVAVGVGLRVVHGHLDLATGLFVLLLAPEAFLPIRRMGASFHDGVGGVEALDAALGLIAGHRHPGESPAPDARGAVLSLHAVQVRYADRSAPALDVDQVRFEPGAMTVVTGPSGCGKSTMLAVLASVQLPDRGSVRVGSTDLTTVDPDAWRTQLAWVPQVPAIRAASVAENVRWGTEATDDDVREALRDAGAADLDPDRQLVEQAATMSAGERRRIAVARALVQVRVGGASIALLDEPTAGLDEARERVVVDSLRRLDATVIVVSHRPATIAAADAVVELGTRAEAVAVS